MAQDLRIACFGNSEKPIWQEWGVYVGIRKNIIEEKLQIKEEIECEDKDFVIKCVSVVFIKVIMEVSHTNNCLRTIYCIPV